MGKPYRVWNAARTVRKSLTASTLKELVRKGRDKLGLGDVTMVTVVLETDGTEVDEEEYFLFLEENTTFLMLTGDETWSPVWETAALDETDLLYGGSQSDGDPSVLNVTVPDRLKETAAMLRRDVTKIVTLSMEELEEVVAVDDALLGQLLGCCYDDASHIAAKCQQYLDEHRTAQDAVSLLRLLSASSSSDSHVPNLPQKRLRQEDDL